MGKCLYALSTICLFGSVVLGRSFASIALDWHDAHFSAVNSDSINVCGGDICLLFKLFLNEVSKLMYCKT